MTLTGAAANLLRREFRRRTERYEPEVRLNLGLALYCPLGSEERRLRKVIKETPHGVSGYSSKVWRIHKSWLFRASENNSCPVGWVSFQRVLAQGFSARRMPVTWRSEVINYGCEINFIAGRVIMQYTRLHPRGDRQFNELHRTIYATSHLDRLIDCATEVNTSLKSKQAINHK